ncbi:DUF4405 domain-containing protein [Paenibacillus sp.]|uniref:DUF4405 domain-containing protein n=1 Tax=Paenibacillus sp. TaxID=58172 RepID=UPI002D4464D4|nr:DUF4405 domain-containing protein [Paenibacillus sp.]HZG85532.1 DUF4405 domain-containing protein [Paenibacillus sp.]
MNRKMLFKLVIDVVMTVLMLIAMAYQITENRIHEFVGVSVFVLFIAHNFLNRYWYRAILKGKLNPRRILQIGLNLLFLLAMAVMIICGILISSDVFPFLAVDNDMIFRQIHVQTAYWGFIIMAIHIGFSWGIIIHSIRRMTGITGTNRFRTIALRILSVFIVIYGVRSSIEREMGAKLMVYDPFYWFDDDTMIRFLIDHLSIMGIYICGTHYALKFFQKQEQRAVQLN